MSEVGEAVQLLVVTGRGAYLLGNITVKSASLVLKVLNTIYLAKWRGKVSMNRLRKICGGDLVFVNMGTEDLQILKGIEKEMKAHGILYARLPDLCGGDGRTQYVIPPADMAKMKAFLLDHKDGRYGSIKAGPISPEDYAKTGLTREGRPTQELAELTQSALNTIPEKQRLPDLGDTLPAERVLQVPEVWDAVKKHDAQIEFGRHVSWIKGEPIKEHSKWGMYQMPDGVRAVIIPKQDMQKSKKSPVTGRLTPAEYAVFDAKEYTVANLQTGEAYVERGRNVILAMNRAERTHAAEKKETLGTMQKTARKDMGQLVQMTGKIPERHTAR